MNGIKRVWPAANNRMDLTLSTNDCTSFQIFIFIFILYANAHIYRPNRYPFNDKIYAIQLHHFPVALSFQFPNDVFT